MACGEARSTRRGDIPKTVSALVPRSATALQGFVRDVAASFRECPSVEASLRVASVLRVMPAKFAATAFMDKTELRLDPLTGDWAIFNKRVYGKSWIPACSIAHDV